MFGTSTSVKRGVDNVGRERQGMSTHDVVVDVGIAHGTKFGILKEQYTYICGSDLFLFYFKNWERDSQRKGTNVGLFPHIFPSKSAMIRPPPDVYVSLANSPL